MACLFSELMLDPAPHGMQMYEAMDLLLRQRPLQPDVPLLVWQVGSLESHLYSVQGSRPGRFVRFRDYLLRTYPPEHVVTAGYAAPHPLVPSRIRQFALGEMLEHARDLEGGVTLYVPPRHERPILDTELFALLNDPSHLGTITNG